MVYERETVPALDNKKQVLTVLPQRRSETLLEWLEIKRKIKSNTNKPNQMKLKAEKPDLRTNRESTKAGGIDFIPEPSQRPIDVGKIPTPKARKIGSELGVDKMVPPPSNRTKLIVWSAGDLAPKPGKRRQSIVEQAMQPPPNPTVRKIAMPGAEDKLSPASRSSVVTKAPDIVEEVNSKPFENWPIPIPGIREARKNDAIKQEAGEIPSIADTESDGSDQADSVKTVLKAEHEGPRPKMVKTIKISPKLKIDEMPVKSVEPVDGVKRGTKQKIPSPFVRNDVISQIYKGMPSIENGGGGFSEQGIVQNSCNTKSETKEIAFN